MEEQFLNFPMLTATILIFLVVFWTWKQSGTKNMPPGPRRLPIIGNMHQLLGSVLHRRLTDLATKYGPVMHLKLGEVSNIIISSPEAAKEVMRTHDLVFATRPAILAGSILLYDFSDIAFAPYGEYWRQMRKLCILEILSVKRVQSFRSIREDEVSNLVQTIYESKGFPVNMSKLITSITSAISSRSVSGKLHENRDEFSPTSAKFKQVLGGLCIVDLFPSVPLLDVISGSRTKMEKIRAETDAMLEAIISEHRSKVMAGTDTKDEADNLVDVLLNLQAHGEFEFPLTLNHIKAILLEMFLAGNETTATLIEWTISELLKNPTVMERAQAEVRWAFDNTKSITETNLHELKYLSLVIKETLRLHPPFPLLFPRESRDKAEINGYKIPAKTRVMVNVWAIGRDPRYWDKPELFYPERFLERHYDFKGTCFEYIPFGAGRRICPGIQFATAVVELALANLLYHFDWKLPDGLSPENLDMLEDSGLAIRRKNDLYAVLVPYSPSNTHCGTLFHKK